MPAAAPFVACAEAGLSLNASAKASGVGEEDVVVCGGGAGGDKGTLSASEGDKDRNCHQRHNTLFIRTLRLKIGNKLIRNRKASRSVKISMNKFVSFSVKENSVNNNKYRAFIDCPDGRSELCLY